MKQRLIITGAQGFVAGSVLAQAGSTWEVHALSRHPVANVPPGIQWHVWDPMDTGKLGEIFRSTKPRAVIHTAALADIDLCQRNPESAWAVNAALTRELSKLCAETAARLVHCSTDTVFDGEHAPYAEEAEPEPINVYAETKAAAEREVRSLGHLGVVARLSLVVGLPMLGVGNSFLVKMLAAFKEGRSLFSPEREVRTPVDVVTLGRALLELAAGLHHGTFHLAGLTRVNRVELGRAIAVQFGFSPDLVTAQPAGAPGGRAPRPRDVSLSTEKTRSALKTPLRSLDEGLALIIETTKP